MILSGIRWNKKSLIGAGFLVLSIVFLVLALLQSPEVIPTVTLNPSEVELGEVKAGETVETRVQLTNTYGLPINSLKVLTSCVCTTAKIEDDALAPGDSTWISFQLTAPERSGGFGTSVVLLYRTENSGNLSIGKEIFVDLIVVN